MVLGYFALETTGVGHFSSIDVLQIGCVIGDDEFNAYLLPENEILPRAADVNGITRDANSNLVRSGTIIPDMYPAAVGLQKFADWLKSCCTRLKRGKGVLLIGHNAKVFSMSILVNSLLKHGIKMRSGLISGFQDTLALARALGETEPLKLTDLAAALTTMAVPPQPDALERAKMVRAVFKGLRKKHGCGHPKNLLYKTYISWWSRVRREVREDGGR